MEYVMSDTHSLLFNDVKVPKENRIGADGFGFNFAGVF
jgi:alkylation response protein AidB-like acyl-CoA dehydrogenase